MNTLYRYEYYRHSYETYPSSEEFITSGSLRLIEYRIVATTPKGYWISPNKNSEDKWKWVSASTRKRFAYPTKQEAINSYIAVKRAYVNHVNRRLANAKNELTSGLRSRSVLEGLELCLQKI